MHKGEKMSRKRYSNRRYLFVVLAMLAALMLSATGGAAAPGKDRHQDNAGNGHRSSDVSLITNIAPPPPPSAPAQTIAKWKGKLDEHKAKLSDASDTTVQALAAAPAVKTGTGVSATATAKTLVLYDASGAYAFLGEQYAIGGANLSSHFGSWTAKPATAYVAGEINAYTAAIYFGSTYDEPLPAAFLNDVLATTKPVLWADFNIWQLANRANQVTPGSFVARYGWDATQSYFDPSSMSAATPVNQVNYKGKALTRDGVNNLSGILNPNISNPALVTVLASAVRGDGSGTTLPWAIRSANLTYIGEIPFSYMKEEDRILAFDDLLFDLYGQTQVHHRAMVRLEDVNATNDPTELKAVADYLYSQGVPFGFGVFPVYMDPLGYFTGTNCTAGVQCGPSQTLRLKDAQVKAVVDALKYLIAHGGTIIEHGYTHQADVGINPYNKVSGDDFEFYRTIENPDHTLNFAGPLPGDSTTWANNRITSSNTAFTQAGLAVPTIFEFPHYSGSAVDYKAVATRFNTRWERTLYFNGLLTGSAVSYTHVFGQLFPYAVRDVYGTVVLPENLEIGRAHV